MAKKSVTKSKSAPKPLLKKYQSAGFNSSTYNQVTNPYYISGTYAEQAGQEADRYLNQAAQFGDYASTSDIRAKQAEKEREQGKKDAIKQIETERQQEAQAFGQEALNTGADATKQFAKTKLAEKAAAKAATEALANSAMQAGAAGVYSGTGVNAAPLFTAPSNLAGVPTSLASTPVTSAVPTITQTGTNFLPGGLSLPSYGTAAVTPTAAATTAGTNLVPGAVEVGSTGVQAATSAGGEAAKTAATTAASTAAKTGLLGNMSGLASAGIGLGLTGAGMLVQRKMDTDPTKFDKKEGRQNVIGDAFKGAGSGFGMGAAAGSFIPGIGNVAGGLIGGVAGAAMGVAKGLKENKESKKYAKEYADETDRIAAEEKRRKTILDKQASEIAQNYNEAFLNSRLTGMQTGFGYNTSTNMNMQPTSAYYAAKTGGTSGQTVPMEAEKLKGGYAIPIGPNGERKFIGNKHSESKIDGVSGIRLNKEDPKDPNEVITEVEHAETEDTVKKANGIPTKYFFSAFLKKGGKSFAKEHEELVKAGADQAAIQQLAKEQEAVANKKGEKDRGPEQIAKYGGIHQYKMAGPEESAMAQSNMDAANVTLRDTNKANAEAPSDQQSAAPGKRTTNSGMVKGYAEGGPKDGNVSTEEWNKMSKDDKYNLIYKLAQNAGDPIPEVTAAQWAIESGWGKQMTGSWNMFGQTTKSKDGTQVATPRDPSGGSKTFANYDNLQDSVTAHVKKWSPKYKDAKTPEEALMMIQNYGGKGRYAEGYPTTEFPEGDWKSYVTNTNKIIEQQKPKLKLGAAETEKPKFQRNPDGSMSAEEYQYLTQGRQPLPSGAAQSTLSPIDYLLLGAGRAMASGASGLAGAGAGAWEGFAGEAFAPNTSAARPTGAAPNMGGRGALRLEAPKPGTAVGPFTGNVGTAKPTFPARVAQTETGLVRQPPFYTDPNFINVEGRTIGLNKTPSVDSQMFKQFRVGPPALADKAVGFTPTPMDVKAAEATATADATTVTPDPTKDPGTEGPFPGEGYFPTAGEVAKKEDEIIKKEDDKKERDKTAPPRNKNINGALLAGLGQLIPVGYALARPYKPEGKLERMAATKGQVGATSIKGAVLPRVNMNAERSASERNTVAIKNAIQNTNAGPGGIAAMIAANSKQNQQSLDIANQEQRANRELAGEEARLGMQASMSNAEMAQRANMANMQNQLAVNQANLDASIQEAKLKLDEKRYKREEIMGALDTAAGRVAGIYKDDRSYKAQERLANAMDDAGSYQRFQYYEDLKKQAKDKDSQFYGKTDKELRDYAAQQYNDYIGTAKTGGARKYTSRLGQLSKGKKTFNI